MTLFETTVWIDIFFRPQHCTGCHARIIDRQERRYLFVWCHSLGFIRRLLTGDGVAGVHMSKECSREALIRSVYIEHTHLIYRLEIL